MIWGTVIDRGGRLAVLADKTAEWARPVMYRTGWSFACGESDHRLASTCVSASLNAHLLGCRASFELGDESWSVQADCGTLRMPRWTYEQWREETPIPAPKSRRGKAWAWIDGGWK